MVDIHCHILPGVDDGAQSLSEALEMARLAADCGVTDLVATSHFRGDEMEMDRLAEMYRRFQRLEELLRREEIPLRLHLGAEILCSEETVDLARQKQLPTIGNTQYVLCEFYFNAEYEYMDDILEQIAAAGYRPVVAHPERYGAIQRDPWRIQRWFHRGYVIQVNKGSVLGAFGDGPREVARWILRQGFAHLLASDAHSPLRRTTDMSRLRAWLEERYPPAYIRLLLEENPGRVIRGADMAPVS